MLLHNSYMPLNIHTFIPNFLLWMNGSSSSTMAAVGYFTMRDETAESRGLDAHC